MKEKELANKEQTDPVVKKAKVYTMPSKFYVEESHRKESKNTLLIVGIIILILAIGGAAVYLFVFKNENPAVDVSNDNSNQANTNNTNANNANNKNINSNVNANKNTNVTPLNTNNANNNLNTDIFVNLNVNTNTTANFNVNTNVSSSKDSDFDELTDVEEILYGTNTVLADTDGDGFVDGLEVSGGYDPNNTGKLEKSNKVRYYSDSDYNYSLLYPTAWAVDADPLNIGGKIFTSGEEFVTVSIQENPAELSAKEWYIAKSPGINSSAVDTVINWDKSLSGALSLDGMTVYYTKGSKAFVISYNINILTQASYKTTFEMMYKSFVASVVAQNTNNLINTNTTVNINSNSNTNTNTNTNTNSNTNSNLNSRL